MSYATGKFKTGDRFKLVANPHGYWSGDKIGRTGVITGPSDGSNIAPLPGKFDGEQKATYFEEDELELIKPEPEAEAGPENDTINHPSHYTAYKGIEVIQLTEQLNFNRGNAVKYIARAGLKNQDTEVEDLRKAAWYLQREIERISNG